MGCRGSKHVELGTALPHNGAVPTQKGVDSQQPRQQQRHGLVDEGDDVGDGIKVKSHRFSQFGAEILADGPPAAGAHPPAIRHPSQQQQLPPAASPPRSTSNRKPSMPRLDEDEDANECEAGIEAAASANSSSTARTAGGGGGFLGKIFNKSPPTSPAVPVEPAVASVGNSDGSSSSSSSGGGGGGGSSSSGDGSGGGSSSSSSGGGDAIIPTTRIIPPAFDAAFAPPPAQSSAPPSAIAAVGEHTDAVAAAAAATAAHVALGAGSNPNPLVPLRGRLRKLSPAVGKGWQERLFDVQLDDPSLRAAGPSSSAPCERRSSLHAPAAVTQIHYFKRPAWRRRPSRATAKTKHRASVYEAHVNPEMSAVLEKLSSGGRGLGLRRWQRRAFRLRGHYLTYTKVGAVGEVAAAEAAAAVKAETAEPAGGAAGAAPRGRVDLAQTVDVLTDSGTHLTLHQRDGTALELRCESAAMAAAWGAALRHLVAQHAGDGEDGEDGEGDENDTPQQPGGAEDEGDDDEGSTPSLRGWVAAGTIALEDISAVLHPYDGGGGDGDGTVHPERFCIQVRRHVRHLGAGVAGKTARVRRGSAPHAADAVEHPLRNFVLAAPDAVTAARWVEVIQAWCAVAEGKTAGEVVHQQAVQRRASALVIRGASAGTMVQRDAERGQV